MNTKSIEDVIAEIDAALQENENVSFPNVAYTQHTINRFGNPPIQDEIPTRDEIPGVDVPTVFDDTPDVCLPDHFSIRELVQHRRWKRAEILTMLGEPDMKVTLSHNYHTAHLYAKARVLAAERSPVWRNVIGRLSQIPLPEHRLNPETFFCSSHGNTEYRRHGYLILCVHCYPVEGHVYYRVRDLYNRGWYAKEIPIFLGEPHHIGESGSGFGAAKLYLKGIVHHTEATEGWQNRPSAVAKRLYLDGGNSRAKIARLLGITQSECYNYTKFIRDGKVQDMPTSRQRASTYRQHSYLKHYLLSMVSEGGKTLTQLTESSLVDDEGRKLIQRILATFVEEGLICEHNGVFTKKERPRQERPNYV